MAQLWYRSTCSYSTSKNNCLGEVNQSWEATGIKTLFSSRKPPSYPSETASTSVPFPKVNNPNEVAIFDEEQIPHRVFSFEPVVHQRRGKWIATQFHFVDIPLDHCLNLALIISIHNRDLLCLPNSFLQFPPEGYMYRRRLRIKCKIRCCFFTYGMEFMFDLL
ncbi:hypothetical protein NPIL_246781 [Nephila pilipes]|uniref:Uncharacterized protein n=1 Tax=Nephila pilipes TaxID=299642 RepID=A0A8X6NIE7_NEPPI|nr:hypothetical protein NPIL_246781 [Nephila pilipes]